jgi:hypothetical protein
LNLRCSSKTIHRGKATTFHKKIVAKSAFLLVACVATIPVTVFAQEHKERTIDEIKVEAIHRAEVGGYPLIGLDPKDVREAFQSIHTRDKDEWAEGFMGVADRYRSEGKALETTDPKKADAEFCTRLASLLLRALALGDLLAKKEDRLRQSHRCVPGPRALHGSAAGGRPHTLRR